MEIKKRLLPKSKLKPLYSDPLQLHFGRHFTDYMFAMEYHRARGWHDAEIRPYGPLAIDPAANVLHYSQEVFEGQKAYLAPDGRILLFRPRDNARRMNRSLRRMSMPEIPEDDYVQAQCELLRLERRWIPSVKGSALYIRPAVIGTEAALGVKPSDAYLFFIILSPVGPYFAGGFKPIRVWVSDHYIRAARGGTGEAKTGGNYAGSLLATQQAKEKGYSQVIWLDGRELRYVEEMGAMNIFFVIDGKLVTPATSDSILHGITRQSLIELARDLDLVVEERLVSIDEVTEGIAARRVSEVFAAGTAAVITPVGQIGYRGRDYDLGAEPGPLTVKLYDRLTDIQYGLATDARGWVHPVG